MLSYDVTSMQLWVSEGRRLFVIGPSSMTHLGVQRLQGPAGSLGPTSRAASDVNPKPRVLADITLRMRHLSSGMMFLTLA
jgi:hypothetical protein